MKNQGASLFIMKMFFSMILLVMLIGNGMPAVNNIKKQTVSAIKNSELGKVFDIDKMMSASKGKLVLPTNVGNDLKRLFNPYSQ